MTARLTSGTMVGGYRIEALLAEGGMGVVYRARQLELDMPVALKVIRPEWAHDDDFRARFKREARLAASLHHPHVVSPHGFGDHEGQLFVVMPLVPGTDLGAVIERDGPLAAGRAAAVIAQVAMALDAAHAGGLVHRDVKPANVLLVGDGRGEHAYLTDFGVAKAISSETKITRLGQLPGTPGYVSPEQINGDPLDARTDVYSLGCVLCETLTGTVPYPRQTPAAMLIAHMTDAPPRVSERMPGAPRGFDAVVGRALAKDPAERYATAGELAGAATAAADEAEAAAQTPRVRRFARRQAAKPPAPAPAAVAAPAPAAPAPSGPAPAAPAPAAPADRELPASAAAGSAPPAASGPPAASAPGPGAAAPPERAATPVVERPARAGAAAALVLAAALAALPTAWAAYGIGNSDGYDSYGYGDRVTAFAAGGAIFTGLVASVAAALHRARSVPLLLSAAGGVWIGAMGGLLTALPYGWDGSPRRYLITIWLLAGLVAGVGITITRRTPRLTLLAAGLGALGGAAGALVAWASLGMEKTLGESGLDAFATATIIASTGIGLGIALAIHASGRFVAPADDSGSATDLGVPAEPH